MQGQLSAALQTECLSLSCQACRGLPGVAPAMADAGVPAMAELG